jgi:hypothetical protein
MIKVTDIKNTDSKSNSFLISAFADTKGEVATGEFVGLPEGAEIEMGSDVMTASGEMAFMKSDGTWNWLG